MTNETDNRNLPSPVNQENTKCPLCKTGNQLFREFPVYNQGDTGTIGYTSGCSGSSHPRGISANTADMPTYTHPNSVVSSVGASFGSINIYEFLYMPYDSSPNHGITGC